MSFFQNNFGLSILGSGSDGTVTITSGTTTLTRIMMYENLTVNAGATIATAGYPIFVRNKLIINGTIRDNGADASTSTGGAARAVGFYAAGSAGPNGTSSAGASSAAVTNSLGARGGSGGAGGVAGGNSGTVTAPSVNNGGVESRQIIIQALRGLTQATVTRYTGGTGGGAGGGGGVSPGTGGGGGAGGGYCFVAARTIIGSGIISADGGRGGNSPSPITNNAGGGGGGGGGFCCVISNNVIPSTVTIRAKGGAGGLATGFAGSVNGSEGFEGLVTILRLRI